MPERASPAVQASFVEAAFWARSEGTLPARLRELSPQSDPHLQTYAARFSLPDATG